MKLLCLSLLLLVLMAELGCAMNRRMVMTAANPRSTSKENDETMKKNWESNGDADVNKHHNIPRPSFGDSDDNQNGSDQPADDHN